MPFNFIKLKQDFLFAVYKHLREEEWDYRILVFEGDDEYYHIVTIAFYDEKGYFRRMEIPLPILKAEAENRDAAKKLLEEINNDSNRVVRLPRMLWGTMPLREIYETIIKRKV